MAHGRENFFFFFIYQPPTPTFTNFFYSNKGGGAWALVPLSYAVTVVQPRFVNEGPKRGGVGGGFPPAKVGIFFYYRKFV